jgi:protoheme IX farnesyltransferase
MRALCRPSAYLALTKPRIVELLLVTTVPSMMAAARGWPGAHLVVSTLVGGSIAAGGANALNNLLDRDIDRVMRRTAHRPVASGEVTAARALLFGLTPQGSECSGRRATCWRQHWLAGPSRST